MNCGKSWFVDADHTCSRADTTVCRSCYKKQKLSHALHRCSVAVLERGIIRLKSNQDISAATFLLS